MEARESTGSIPITVADFTDYYTSKKTGKPNKNVLPHYFELISGTKLKFSDMEKPCEVNPIMILFWPGNHCCV